MESNWPGFPGKVLGLVLMGWVTVVPALGSTEFEAGITRMESRLQGRIGLFAAKDQATVGHRAHERFAYCSAFKCILVAAVLKQAEEGRLDLGREVCFNRKDLVGHSPVTGAHLRDGHMQLRALCEAALTDSDNTAANLLESIVGGPPGMQALARSLGDPIMRFDRPEPDLNSNLPGDPRDTTTPEAMTGLLRSLTETAVLLPPSRDCLLGWMEASLTGENRIRAGVPRDWTVADKTGTGANGAAIDIAVIQIPGEKPLFLSVFLDGGKAGGKERDEVIAQVTRLVVMQLQGSRAD